MRIVPHSLDRRFKLAFGLLLIPAGLVVGAALLEIDRSRRSMLELSDHQLRTMEATTRLASLTGEVTSTAASVIRADDPRILEDGFKSIGAGLNEIENLLPELADGQAGDEILDLHIFGQAYLTTVNAAVQLGSAALREERALDEAPGRPSPPDEEALAVLRRRQLVRRATLRKFETELGSLGGKMTRLAQDAAKRAREDYKAAMKSNLDASRDSVLRLATLLTGGMLAAYLIVRQLLEKRILRRIDAVSARLRGAPSAPDIAVREGDEIGDMARAVEEFLEDRRKLEETRAKLEVARTEADRANRMKSEFLANMSHEIRTPMNAILGYAQLMASDPELPTPQRDRVNTINRAGEHLLELINDILEMSKIEAGRITLNESAFDLREMLDDVVELNLARADAKGLSLRLEVPPDFPRHIRSDEGKVRQALVNLIGNAVKFTVKGGVTVSAKHTPAADGATGFTFTVADTGPGIAPAEMGRLFKPFVQSAAGVSAGGTGLGLAISRRYAQLLGGDITVDSVHGHGAEFHLTLVAHPSAAAAVTAKVVAPKVSRLSPGQAPVRVLVADDVALNRQLISAILKPMGFEVRHAADGALAVEAFKEWHPHAILMDMRMPVMDGYESSRRIKAAPGGHDVFILALTASAFEEDKAAVLAAGADAFMRKPFRQEELLALLGERLGLRYDYADTNPPANKAAPTTAPSVMPEALRQDVIKACGEADFEKLSEIGERLAVTGDIHTAEHLRRLLAAFDYEGIVRELAPAPQ